MLLGFFKNELVAVKGVVNSSTFDYCRRFTEENLSLEVGGRKKADPTPLVNFNTSLDAFANLGSSQLGLDDWEAPLI